MATISFRTVAKTAAVAGALGLAASFGAPAATAQSTEDGSPDFGSLFTILDLETIGGSVQGSLKGSDKPSPLASTADLFTANSVGIAFGSAEKAPGSLGDLAKLVNNTADTQGSIAGSLSDSVKGEGDSPLGSIDPASLGEFFKNVQNINEQNTPENP